MFKYTAKELLESIKNNQTKPQEILAALKGRMDAVEGKVKAYARPGKDVLDTATTARSGNGPYSDGPLSGVPVAIKDNICTEGMLTECCSRILEGFRPPYDATVVRKLKEHGAVIMNTKTNMDEFAFGSSTENSCFGASRNPWNTACVPGGSSGGSAAAVAADEAICALGSDTGGSIRQPAAFCGVVGLKPTYGRVSRYGLIAFASSLDQIGPITKDVYDNALILNAIAGHDPMDATSVDMPVPDYTTACGKDIAGLKIGIPKEYFIDGMDADVKSAIDAAIEVLKSKGAACAPVSLPHTRYAVPVYYLVATAEASSNLARFDGVQYGLRSDPRDEDRKTRDEKENSIIGMYKTTRGAGFGDEAKRRIILGTFALSHGYYDAYYLTALKVRTLIKRDFDAVFKDFDCVLTPTAPTGAFTIGEKTDDPLKMYLSDIYTISANLAGIPGISLPCGFTKARMPVGMQLLGKAFDEEMLFRVAHAYEQATTWHTERPKII